MDRLNITFFMRSDKSGISIGRAFRPLIKEIGKSCDTQTYYMPSANYNISGIIQCLWFTFKHRNKKGINHVTGGCHFIILALLGCKTVLTIHDLGFYTSPNSRGNWLKRKFLYYLQIYLPIKYATKVVAISEKTKQEIYDTIPFRREIDILRHHSIDEFVYTFKQMDKNNIQILHLGTNMHKNLETTLKAVAKLKNVKLTVIQPMSTMQISLADLLGVDYVNRWNLPDSEVIKEYQNTDIVCFPTLHEGLGAITIEAQSVGRPVITTNREPMSSVSGGAAYLLNDPTDEDELVVAIRKIVDDDDYRKSIIDRGRENANLYTVANCAKDHINYYELI